MRLIIAGSRGVTAYSIIELAIKFSELQGKVTEVVSGTAMGVDRLGEQWAATEHLPVKRFPAAWDKFGRSAGYKRNEQMAQYADALLAVWDNQSKGTQHMINIMKSAGKPVFLVIAPVGKQPWYAGVINSKQAKGL